MSLKYLKYQGSSHWLSKPVLAKLCRTYAVLVIAWEVRSATDRHEARP